MPIADLTRLILQIPWKPGPAADTNGPAVVSVTELTLDHAHHLPGAYRNGLRLRRDWPWTPGAVGLWGWTRPWQRRLGAVSVWRTDSDLRSFLILPEIVALRQAYRSLGVVRSVKWTVPRFNPAEVWDDAVFQIDAWSQGYATLR